MQTPAIASCLDDAAKFAERVCGEISKEGTSSSASAKAGADVKANNIFSKIIGSGSISASTDYAREEYVGVVRDQLTNDRFNVRECRIKMVSVAMAQGCKVESTSTALGGNETTKVEKFIKIDSIFEIGKTNNHYCSSNCNNEPTRTSYTFNLTAPISPEGRKRRLVNPSLVCIAGACPFSQIIGPPRITDNGQVAKTDVDVWGYQTRWKLSADLEELR